MKGWFKVSNKLNERALEISDLINNKGMTGDEVAARFGYSSERSMRTLMYRWGYKWDKNKYVLKDLADSGNKKEKVKPTTKVSQIIDLLSVKGFDVDEICKKVGFKNHREIAEFMTSKGYVWSPERENYVRQTGLVEEEIIDDEEEIEAEKEVEIDQSGFNKIITSIPENNDLLTKLVKYLPLLEMLEQNKEKIVGTISAKGNDGTIPRYVLPGRNSGKTIQMSDSLQDMAVEFCNEKNIKQRELFEVALIEFFKKYGYEFEIESLLRSS